MSIYRGHTKNEVYLASLLYDAIEDSDLRSIRTLLINKGANPNLVLPKKHIAPFHLIIGNDDEKFALDVVILILQNGGNPNVKADDGLTPLHIAAAWGRLEIVSLLLLSGGDPEQCDHTKKTPIHYAFEENYAECFDLLRRFADDKYHYFNRDKDDRFNLVLDKIIVNNGTTLGEYEIVNEYKTDNSSLQRKNVQKIDDLLPKTDTNEYVLNWCNNQLTNNSQIQIQRQNSSETSGHATEFNTDENSSINESDGNITDSYGELRKFHKIYRKKMKKSPQKTNNNLTNDSIGNFPEISGIVPFEITKNKQEISSNSDYLTCSTVSGVGSGNSIDNNVHEKNIFEITNDDEEIKSIVTKSEGIDSDVNTTITISEIYKYTDKDDGVVLYERRLLKTPVSDCSGSIKSLTSYKSSLPETLDYEDYDTDTIRKELTSHGYNPGPITVTTKRVYLKKLKQIRKYSNLVNEIGETPKRVYSSELEKTLKNAEWLKNITEYKQLDDIICKQFNTTDYTKRWREGTNKSSFTYLLLDPRITNNLPNRAEQLKPNEIWECFLSSIFYVGKGKRSRPYSHLYEAITVWNQRKQQQQQQQQTSTVVNNQKLERILNIWNDNCGVVCLHLFQNTIPVEAYTREAAIILALKIENLCNQKYGDFYGVSSTWSKKEKTMFGVFLLYKAMMIFLNEGERQLCPQDID